VKSDTFKSDISGTFGVIYSIVAMGKMYHH